MKKVITLLSLCFIAFTFISAQERIKYYTIDKHDGTQFQKMDSISYDWSGTRGFGVPIDYFLNNSFLGKWYVEVPVINFNTFNLYKWEGFNYEPSEIITNTLDVNGNVVENLNQIFWNGVLENDKKLNNTYNSNGFNIEQTVSDYNLDSNKFILDLKSILLYNSQNKIAESILIDYHKGGTFDTTHKNVFTYFNGKLIEQKLMARNLTNNTYSNQARIIYTYDSILNQTVKITQDNSNGWKNDRKEVFTYNIQNDLTSLTYEEWYNNNWSLNTKKDISYNLNDIVDIIESNFNFTSNSVIPEKRYEFVYDSLNRLKNIIEQSYLNSNVWSSINGDLKYTFSYEPLVVGLQENKIDLAISIFPNPASEYIEIALKNHETIDHVKIMDISGKVVFKNAATLTSNQIKIPVYHLDNGTYILTVESKGSQKSEKIVVRH